MWVRFRRVRERKTIWELSVGTCWEGQDYWFARGKEKPKKENEIERELLEIKV